MVLYYLFCLGYCVFKKGRQLSIQSIFDMLCSVADYETHRFHCRPNHRIILTLTPHGSFINPRIPTFFINFFVAPKNPRFSVSSHDISHRCTATLSGVIYDASERKNLFLSPCGSRCEFGSGVKNCEGSPIFLASLYCAWELIAKKTSVSFLGPVVLSTVYKSSIARGISRF